MDHANRLYVAEFERGQQRRQAELERMARRPKVKRQAADTSARPIFSLRWLLNARAGKPSGA